MPFILYPLPTPNTDYNEGPYRILMSTTEPRDVCPKLEYLSYVKASSFHMNTQLVQASQPNYIHVQYFFFLILLCSVCCQWGGGGIEGERDLENHYISFYFQFDLYLS